MNTLKKDKKLFIGIFTDSYPPQINGVSLNVQETANSLRQMGHTVYVFAPKMNHARDTDPYVIRLDSVRLVKNPEVRMGRPTSFREFLHLASDEFDIIHGHGGGSISILGYQVSLARNIPYIFTYHTLYAEYLHYVAHGKLLPKKVAEISSKLFCNLTDVVIAPSAKIETELIRYGVKKQKIQVIPGGINTSQYAGVSKGFLRKKLGISAEKHILLFVGRLGKEKNIRFLLDAFSEVIKKEQNSVFVIVGDGPEKKNLQAYAKKLGLTKNIFFTGFIGHTDMPKVYKDADVFLFASTTETQGLVIIEALAAGIPVVAVKDPAVEEMMKDAVNGFLVKHETSEFSEKVYLLLEDRKLYQSFSEQARGYVLKDFSSQKQAEVLENVYVDTISYYAKNPKMLMRVRKKFMPGVQILKTFLAKVPLQDFLRRF